jgi:ABC-2 type transport system ATP-binding protein
MTSPQTAPPSAPSPDLAAATAAADAIRTVDLTKTYPGTDFKAVDGLNLAVHRGEIFGLLGPNGAGKTTTAGMLTTRVIPSSGEAYVGGVDVIHHPTVAKQLLGVVSQQNTLDRQLSVWENLYFHGRLFGMPGRECKDTADELLEKFKLTKWGKASVYALSGGMAQRLMVARSIFHRPAVLFMDEPTAGLDPQSRLSLWDILNELNAEGQTILLTTHYMEEADQLCNRVAIMDHGRILALDTPAGLKQSIGADTIVKVRATGELDRFEGVIQRDLEGVTRTRQIDGAVEAHVQGASQLLPKLMSIADHSGFQIVDLSVTEPSLETVFINLTGKDLRD